MAFVDALRVKPGRRVNLAAIDAGDTHGVVEGGKVENEYDRCVERIGRLVHTLGADKRFGVLVVLQGMDTAGKDGTLRRVFKEVDPQLIRVATFRKPSEEELAHDFLWRIHRQTPRRGQVVVFNRSHYEDVGIVRVHKLVPEKTLRERYGHINDFEELLSESGTVVLKFFLHISKAEQRQRLKARLDDPSKNWKMDLNDLAERKHWNAYMRAYSDAISRCSTKRAPWYVIPSDHKWFRHYAVAAVVEDSPKKLNLRYPKPPFDASKIVVR